MLTCHGRGMRAPAGLTPQALLTPPTTAVVVPTRTDTYKDALTWERFPVPCVSPDLPVAFLFGRLGIATVLSIVGALLTQRPVLLHARDAGVLTPTCEAILSLLHPLTWEDVYVPVLPASLIDMVHAPTGYFIGQVKLLRPRGPQGRPRNGATGTGPRAPKSARRRCGWSAVRARMAPAG